MSKIRTTTKGVERDEKIKDLTYLNKENRHGKVMKCSDPEDIKLV